MNKLNLIKLADVKEHIVPLLRDEISMSRFAEILNGIANKVVQTSNIGDCSERIIEYIENDAEISMPINELINEDGSHITKKQYGRVLLKYLVIELRDRFT